MASTTKKGRFYYAVFRDATGKRRQQATRETNRHEAQMKADLLEFPYHLSQAGSEAALLHLMNSKQWETYNESCRLVEKLESLGDSGGKLDEALDLARDLRASLRESYQAARKPLTKVIKVNSSFTGMPPEADLEIRTSFRLCKKRGGGDMKLHLATRMLSELNVSGCPLSDPGHRTVWKSSWVSLGEAILRTRDLENIPVHSLIRSASELLEKGRKSQLDQLPDTNETRLFWYVACCYKRNGRVAPRRAIHVLAEVWSMSRPTINRILKSWEETSQRYDPDFEFPMADESYDDLADFFPDAEHLKRARSTYFKIEPLSKS